MAIICTRIAAAIAAGFILAGSAALGDDVKTKSETKQETKQDKAVTVARNPKCLTQTDNRSAVKGHCGVYGRSYTNDDMRRTGATTVAGALPRLDPSITIHH